MNYLILSGTKCKAQIFTQRVIAIETRRDSVVPSISSSCLFFCLLKPDI